MPDPPPALPLFWAGEEASSIPLISMKVIRRSSEVAHGAALSALRLGKAPLGTGYGGAFTTPNAGE